MSPSSGTTLAVDHRGSEVAAGPSPAARGSLARGGAIASWMLQLAVAAILFQTLFFKFTAAPESVAIFTKLGAEPWGRIASGVLELVASILLVVPSTATAGALLALGIISGAIASHLAVLGIAVRNSDGTSDGGLLFGLAVAVFLGSLAVLATRRRELAARLAVLARRVRARAPR